MRKHWILLGAALALSSVVASASAADLRTPAQRVYGPSERTPLDRVSNWTGCHAGVQVGHGTYDQTRDTSVDGEPFVTAKLKSTGPVFGGVAGCDYQFTAVPVVVGAFFEYAGTNIKKSQSVNVFDFGGGFTIDNHYQTSIKSLWLAAAKLGWEVFPRVLLSGHVGFAGGTSETSVSTTFAGFNINTALNEEKLRGVGYGGAVAWMLPDRWVAEISYTHYDFKDRQLSNTTIFGTANTLVKSDADVIKGTLRKYFTAN